MTAEVKEKKKGGQSVTKEMVKTVAQSQYTSLQERDIVSRIPYSFTNQLLVLANHSSRCILGIFPEYLIDSTLK